MSNKWGKDEQYRWPSDKPVWTFSMFFIAVIIFCLGLWRQYAVLTPLQQWWLRAYMNMSLMEGFHMKASPYRLLEVEDQAGRHRLALDSDVVAIPIEQLPAGSRVPFALSEESANEGSARLVLEPSAKYENTKLREYVRHWIYQDATLGDMAMMPLYLGLGFLPFGLAVAIVKDRERMRIRKYGRRVRGPEFVTAAEFNQRNGSNGLGFVTNEPRTFSEKLLRRDGSMVRIPRARESSHCLIMGDTETGKSALIRQILIQLAQRGDTAIVYDPALEYTPQFYNPQRGDQILNPLDARMPHWSPGDEVEHEAEAATLAASLFPERPNEQRFFTRGPKEIFAHLLTYKPTAEELAWWMTNDEEIERRVKGSEVESLIAASAPAQREGVLSELKMVGKVLKLLPKERETKASWNTRDWSRQRKGWLFLTSTPDTRERLAPLISLWLDTLVLRLMREGITNPNARPVWFVLDELASLQKLPQLHTAVTENRKANCPMVLGFQGRSQLEARYGLEAEAMLSQPATKIFLRTSEPKSAKWIAETIGDREIELLRETRSQGHYPESRDTRSFQLERRCEPLVMASEVCGLPSLHGFLKCENLVVQLSFPYITLPKIQPGFILRETGPMRPPAPDEAFGLIPPRKPPQRSDKQQSNGDTPQSQQPQHDERYWR
jgi:hypothetical protein